MLDLQNTSVLLPGAPARLALFVCGAALLAGCSSNKNQDERERLVGTDESCTCIDTCRPDPGSGPVDCDEAVEGLEFIPIWDFESGTGINMYTYDDGSTRYMEPSGWQPRAGLDERSLEPDANPGGPCDSNFALHVRGGPFRSWGGGLGISLRTLTQRCCDGRFPDCCPDPDGEFVQETIDLSQWEGVSFWARRGPDSQAGIRVMVGDKRVDDDLAYLSYVDENAPDVWQADYPTPTYCRRIRECGCKNHKPCTWWEFGGAAQEMSPFMPPVIDTGPGMFCFDPLVDPPPGTLDECGRTIEYQRCGEDQCELHHPPWPEHGPDPEFSGRPCAPFAFPGSFEGSYCFEPGVDPDPPDYKFQCGDYWFSPVRLSTDWRFYTVPFTDMHQQGWAMESYFFDLTGASVMRFTFDRGWIDYWIDDVSFYRRVR